MKNLDRRNKYFFGLGTIGRDMFYAFEANALLYFLSNILSLPIHVFAAVSLVLSVLRIADALTHKKQTHFLHQGNTGITQNLSYIGG